MGELVAKLKASAVAAVVMSGCHTWFLRRHCHHVTILMYHGFFEENRADGLEQYGSRWCGIGDFKGQLDYLRCHTHVISFEQLVEHYQTGTALPDNAVVITMDDGYASNYRLAYPLLKQRGIPACIFVSSRFVEHREFLWPDRLEYSVWKTDSDELEIIIDDESLRYPLGDEQSKIEAVEAIKLQVKDLCHRDRMTLISQIEDKTGQTLSDQGETPALLEPLGWNEIGDMIESSLISIGSHTVRHPNLTTCTDEQLRDELVSSKALIAQKTGKACSLFCYPGGAYDARVKRFTEEAGYHCAVAIGGAFEKKGETDLFELKRVGVARGMRVYGFIGRLLR